MLSRTLTRQLEPFQEYEQDTRHRLSCYLSRPQRIQLFDYRICAILIFRKLTVCHTIDIAGGISVRSPLALSLIQTIVRERQSILQSVSTILSDQAGYMAEEKLPENDYHRLQQR